MAQWVRKNGYWYLDVPQKSSLWKAARFGRITMSQISRVCQNDQYPFPYLSLEKSILAIVGLYEEVFTSAALARMNHGVLYEDLAREWYCRWSGRNVIEIGIAVPDFDVYLGDSPDGIVANEKGEIILEGSENGCLEIKCPKRMYTELLGPRPSYPGGLYERKYAHIKHYHYDQMQGHMAVLRKDWCDYVVFATESNQIYIERVQFDSEYWQNDLYPRCRIVLEAAILPLLHEQNKSPLLPPIGNYSFNEAVPISSSIE